MSPRPRRQPPERNETPSHQDPGHENETQETESRETGRAAFEPFARFPLQAMGPEWFEPNWLTGTNWFGHWDHLFPTRWPTALPNWPRADSFRIEEHDEGDTHVIRAEIPGLDPETDITIEVDNDVLTVSATRERHSETRGEVIRSEFSYGTFRRTLRLPPGATAEHISATYDAGVLEIRIARPNGRGPVVSIPIRAR